MQRIHLPACPAGRRADVALARTHAHHPTTWLVPAAAALLLLTSATSSRAELRCPIELQQNVCAEATGSCPAYAPVGPVASDWPNFQFNRQHTGKTTDLGPTCPNEVWTSKVKGKVLSAPVIGGDGTLFIASAKNPVCALNPADGSIYWCDTDNLGRLPDLSSMAIGNGDIVYVGTRDNDFWAIDIPPTSSTVATVDWRQKICTDGDISTSPIISDDGLVYMASNSLGAATIMAMCPGPTRTVKWCVAPLSGGISDVSPALSPAGDVLYLVHSGAFLLALDPETGQQLWEIQLEDRLNGVRVPNYTPVVNPSNGHIYVGLDTGLWEVTPPPSLPGTPTKQLLLPTYATKHERVQSPPALDLAHGTIFVIAARGQKPTFYALALNGTIKWQKDYTMLGHGRARNTPPVVDAAGNVYQVVKKAIHAFSPTGALLWTKPTKTFFATSPIISNGRLYAAVVDGTTYAIGDCP